MFSKKAFRGVPVRQLKDGWVIANFLQQRDLKRVGEKIEKLEVYRKEGNAYKYNSEDPILASFTATIPLSRHFLEGGGFWVAKPYESFSAVNSGKFDYQSWNLGIYIKGADKKSSCPSKKNLSREINGSLEYPIMIPTTSLTLENIYPTGVFGLGGVNVHFDEARENDVISKNLNSLLKQDVNPLDNTFLMSITAKNRKFKIHFNDDLHLPERSKILVCTTTKYREDLIL